MIMTSEYKLVFYVMTVGTMSCWWVFQSLLELLVFVLMIIATDFWYSVGLRIVSWWRSTYEMSAAEKPG